MRWVAPVLAVDDNCTLAHSNGRLYVVASGMGQLISVENEKIIGLADGFPGAHDVVGAPDGTVWIADNFQQRLVQFDQDLKQL